MSLCGIKGRLTRLPVASAGDMVICAVKTGNSEKKCSKTYM